MAAALAGRQLLRLTAAAASRAGSRQAPLQLLQLNATFAPAQAQQLRAFSQQHKSRRNSSSDGGANARDLRFQRDGRRARSADDAAGKARRWMQQRAAAGDFLAIVRGVAECYAPLFRSHPALAEHTCALAELVAQRTGAAATVADGDATDDGSDVESVGQPRYRENRTKMMEQLALETLFKSNEAELAVAVYENRRRVADAIARSGQARDESEARMDEHYRSFFSLAAGAYAALNKHEQVVQVYEAAAAAKLWPTVTMNVNYVRALSTLHRFDDVAAAYAHISAADGVQNIFFYRCMLYYAGVAGDVAVMRDVFAKMAELRFALRPVDYAHCMRAFDRQYYALSKKDTKGKTGAAALPVTSYLEYQATKDAAVEGDEEGVEMRAHAVDAARSVLQIFDQLIATMSKKKRDAAAGFITEELGKVVYPRVLTAAIIAGSTSDGAESAFARVHSIVNTRRERGNAPFGDDALQYAVTGLLLGGQPLDAWRLVQDEFEHVSVRPRAYSAIVSNVLGYLCAARIASEGGDPQPYTALILTVLEDLRRREVTTGTVANPQVRAVIDALCADAAALPDEQRLLQVVADNNAVFRARDKVFWFVYFLTSCVEHERFAAAKSAFQARDAKEVPTIPAALALSCMESYAARGDFEFVYRLSRAVNLDKCTPSDKRAVGYHAIRACSKVDWLGDDEIREIVDMHLQEASPSEFPSDIQALLAPLGSSTEA